MTSLYVAGNVVLPENAVIIHRSVLSPKATFEVNAVNANSTKLIGSLYDFSFQFSVFSFVEYFINSTQHGDIARFL